METIKNFAGFTIIGLLALSISGHTAQVSQSSDEILKRQVAGINLNDVTTINAMTSLLSGAGVPGGIAIVTECGEDIRYTFASSGSTLRNTLDAIVSANPQFSWQVSDGVVNVSPLAGDPPLLSLTIGELRLNGAHSTDEAANQLFAIPEIQKRLAELHLSYGYTRFGIRDLKRPGSAPDKEEQRYNLTLKNVTVRDALNAIARAHGKAVWLYRERHCNGSTEFQINFPVS